MRFILKLIVFPFFIIISFINFLANLLASISSYAIVLLLFVIVGCSIYCVAKTEWLQVGLLAGMGVVSYLVLFFITWSIVKMESLCDKMGNFLWS